MRLLPLLGAAALALSGCSFLGIGHQSAPSAPNYSYYPAATQNTGRISKWNLEGAVGQEFMVGGDFTTPDDVTPLAGVVGTAVSMKDAYETGMRYEVGISKTLNPNRKLTLMGSYSSAEGKDVVIGAVAGNQVTGKANDYNAYTIEAGLRQYFAPGAAPIIGSMRPYIEGRIGASKVEDIILDNARVGGAVLNGGTVNMYEGGWVPTAAGMVGIETPVFRQTTLALETGLRYRGALDGDTTFFGGANPLNGINNDSSNLTVPVTLRGRYRF